MPSSMTGFGRHEYVSGTKKIIVEIKSVNHRYLDLSVKLSKRITSLDQKIRTRVKEAIGRGKVDVYIHYEEAADENYEIRYNPAIANAYLTNMRAMAEELGVTDDITVTKLAAFPDVFEVISATHDENELWDTVVPALDIALQQFVESRRIEGEKLKTDLVAKMHEMRGLVEEIEKKSPEIVKAYKERLFAKVEELAENKQIDETRIATEVVLFADKICVDEEIVRLKSHIDEVIRTLETEDAVGRKLDFLAQEMNREANTILSKSTDVIIADVGISIKTLNEKVREQIQNLE